MLGSTVKMDNIELLYVLYPDYVPKTYVSFLDKETNVIYIGKHFNGLTDYLKKNTKSFINTVGNPDIDLSNKITLSEYILDAKGKKLTPKLQSFLESIDDKEFNYCIKLLALNGKLPYDISKNSSLFDLYKSLSGPTHELLKVFNSLYEVYPHEVIESSLLTFLTRIANNLTEGISPRYSLLIKTTKSKIGDKLKPSIHKYATSSQSQLDLLSLILELVS